MGRTNLMKLNIQKFASGNVSGGNYSNIYSYYMTWSSTSNGSQANTSNVTVNWIYKKNANDPYGAYNKAGSSKVTLVINGNSSGAMRADFDLRSAAVGATQTIASYTVNNVPHNADGSCTINISGTHVTGINFGTVSIGSTAITLDKIPRYANITSFTVSKRDETSVKYNWSADAVCDWAWYSLDGSNWYNLPNDGVVGGLSSGTGYNFYLRVRRTDSQLTSTAGPVYQETYYYPHVTGCTSATIGDPISVNVYNPLGRTYYLELISTNNNQVLATYQGANTYPTGFNTQTQQDNMYASIPNSAQGQYRTRVTYGSWVHEWDSRGYGNYYVNTTTSKPTFSTFTWEDVNPTTLALTGNNSTVVLGYSNIEATISTANKAQANNEASMSYYLYECGGQSATINYSDSESVSGTINKATSGSFKVSAVDSRGLSTPITLNAQNIINYSDLIKGEATINRVGEVSEQATLEFEGDMWVGNFGAESNEITNVTYRYKTGYDDWTSGTTVITPTVDQDGHFTFSGLIKGDTNTGFDEGNVYTIEITVYDQLSSITYTVTLAAGKPHLAWYKDGLSIMGKYDENRNDALQVNGDTNVKGDILINGTNILDIIYPVGIVIETAQNVNPSTLLGFGTWHRISSGGHTSGYYWQRTD